jgi:hypothetical protein
MQFFIEWLCYGISVERLMNIATAGDLLAANAVDGGYFLHRRRKCLPHPVVATNGTMMVLPKSEDVTRTTVLLFYYCR